jgi:hypothetical protein
VILIFSGFVTFACAQSKKEFAFLVVKRDDNNISTFRDSLGIEVDLPFQVKNKFDSILNSYEEFLLPKTRFLVFNIEYSAGVEIYILKVNGSLGIKDYHILAFDHGRNLVSKQPQKINGKWMENGESGFREEHRLLDTSPTELKDYNSDGVLEFVFKQRVHNGTSYNALVEHVFSIEQDMQLRPILFLESKCESIIDDCLIQRVYDPKSKILKVTVSCEGRQFEELGEVYLLYSNSGFSVQSQDLFLEKYEGLLVTGSGMNSEDFLNKGYEPKY